jgi:hypothetical protein
MLTGYVLEPILTKVYMENVMMVRGWALGQQAKGPALASRPGGPLWLLSPPGSGQGQLAARPHHPLARAAGLVAAGLAGAPLQRPPDCAPAPAGRRRWARRCWLRCGWSCSARC